MEQLLDSQLDTELRTAYQRLRDIKREDIAVVNRLNDIDANLAKLAKERDDVMLKRRKLNIESLEPAIPLYSKAWNQSFFCAIRTWLPRELRDLVYTQLWDQKTLDANEARMMFHLKVGCQGPSCATGDYSGCSHHKCLPHFTKPAFVSRESASEVVEAWYKVMQSMEWHSFIAFRVQDIERFVTADAFFVGITPANVLRKLKLRFDMEDFVLSPDTSLAPHQVIARYLLEYLLKIRNKRGFKLDIVLLQRRIRLNLWSAAFDLLAPIVRDFLNEGAHVNIAWNYVGIIPEQVEYDLKPLILDRHEDWKTDVIVFFDTSHPEIDERHCHFKYEDKSDYDPDDYASSEEEEEEDEYEFGQHDEWLHDIHVGGGCSCLECDGTYDVYDDYDHFDLVF